MSNAEKKRLSQEAAMQTKALRRINLWKNIAIAISALGVGLLYAGLSGMDRNLFFIIPGITIMVIGVISALVLNLGLKNGRRNVQAILNAISK